MDMAVANLFKREIRLTLDDEVTEIYEPMSYRRIQYYVSPIIENVESVDASLFKPFALYALSKVVHEDHDIHIDYIEIFVGINDLQEYGSDRLVLYQFANPLASPELFFTRAEVYTRPFPNHLLNQPFQVNARVTCYYICSYRAQEVRFRRAFNYYDHWQYQCPIEYCLDDEIPDYEIPDEESLVDISDISDDEEEDPPAPLIETYRRERCVICLESKPNILYLDCAHIAVCDSCDVGSNQCVVCREEISKRIKI